MQRRARYSLNEAELEQVPAKEGVYQLFDEGDQVLRISGTPHLRDALAAARQEVPVARSFSYETTHMYTLRESELLQIFMRRHHKLPQYNGLADDLF